LIVTRLARGLAALTVAVTAGTAAAATARSARDLPGADRPPLEQAREARTLEEIGAYARAAEIQKALRGRVPPDADLELALALNEARGGHLDSAAARLAGPALAGAAVDSLPVARRREYPWEREGAWVNGRFDGWHWYVVRARAEVAAARGRWDEARAAARAAVLARPLSGKEWAILAVCAGQAGDAAESREAARRATELDPSLPEGFHLAGIWAARDGRRAEAQTLFRRAIALDSTWRAPALAMVKSRLPGSAAEPLPAELLAGVRRAALLTSMERPKLEEFVQMDLPATIVRRSDPPAGEARPGTKPLKLAVSVLVDEQGRAVLNDLPWFTPEHLAPERVAEALATLPDWDFTPARRLGEASRVWATVEFTFNP
jgi:tetratricopeptide (TPR) repeat protein